MSDVEKLEAEYRSLATKLIYASMDGELDRNLQAELDKLGERLSKLNAADFFRAKRPAELHA